MSGLSATDRSGRIGQLLDRAQRGLSTARRDVERLRERARRERGVRVRETFTIRGPAANETEARVSSVLTDVGCSKAEVGPGSYRFARAIRPLPLTVGGTIATVATLGLALPALFFRRTEECWVSVAESPTGAQVTVVGVVPAAAMARLRSNLAAPVWMEDPVKDAVDHVSVAVPVDERVPAWDQTVTAPRHRSAAAGAEDRTRARRSRPAAEETLTARRAPAGDTADEPATRPVESVTRPVARRLDPRPRPSAPRVEPPTRPVARPAPAPEDTRSRRSDERGRAAADDGVTRRVRREDTAQIRRAEVVLEFDTGERVPVRVAVVVGRNPDPALGTPIRVEDRDRAISKSHFRIVIEPDGTWIEDLQSTNGTSLELPDGREGTVHPGRRYPLTIGAVVVFGDRRARLMTD